MMALGSYLNFLNHSLLICKVECLLRNRKICKDLVQCQAHFSGSANGSYWVV